MKFAFIFPGQGSQKVGMGKEIYENFQSAKNLLDTATSECGIDFGELLFSPNDKLGISEFTQPAIVLNSFMCYLALKEKLDIAPSVCLGHSLGEFSALGVSGAAKMTDILNIVRNRGKFMQSACEGQNAGMMVVLGLDDEVINKIANEAQNSGKAVWAVNFNCDGQVVLAGNKDDLATLVEVFKSNGAKRAMLLDMSVASHCPMLAPASQNLAPMLEVLNDEFAPVISNVTAKPYSTKASGIELLKAQLISPVLYKQSIKAVEDEVDCFVEFGANVLKGINKKITQKPTFSVLDLASLDEFVAFAKENA